MQIRLNPEIFMFITTSMKQSRETMDSCVESFAYSYFLDLVHPESTEAELLEAIQNLIRSELIALKETGHVSGLLHESYVLRNMLRHYLRRRNQRKYMKLIFKKGLRDIIHNQDTIKNLKLDPKLIYNEEIKKEKYVARNSVPEITKEKKEKKSFFKRRESKKTDPFEPEKHFESISTEDAMHNDEVYKIVVDRSFQIIEHCKSLLEGIYSNVDTMPFGLRWICKQMILLIQEITPEVNDVEKFTLLGNFIFTNWWIPAIFDPVKNGLLPNVIIQNQIINYLKQIGTIFKHIFKQSFFEEFQYFKINEFIADENHKMQQFLRDIITFDEDTYNRGKVKLYGCSFDETLYNGDNKTMYFYYHSKLSQPIISNSDTLTKSKNHMEDEKNMKEFKIITFVIGLADIKFLAKLVKEKEDQVAEKGWNDLLRYAKTIRNSDELKSLYQPNYLREKNISEQDELYCFFIKRDFGEYTADIENSYMSNLRKSKFIPGDNEHLKLLVKVQEAIRNLLISLDMSIFFDPNKEWSLLDIIEFVIQFSYLFENKKTRSQDRVPLKLLAQFLSTYLKEIPQEFKSNSYRKLYKVLLKDYEERYEFMRNIATRNKKLLLLGINFMEKHIVDLRQEVKMYETLKQKSYALDFIKKGRVNACLLTVKEGSKPTTQVFSQTVCPHSKLASVNEFVMGSKKTLKSFASIDDTHVTTIEEFYEKFMKLPQVIESTQEEDDQYNVGGAFFEYLSIVKEIIRKESGSGSEDDIEMAIEEIEKHITSSMFYHIFPKKASESDKKLYNRTLEHDWVKPEHLDIIPAHRNEAMWKFAIEALKNIDSYRSPADKLNCLVNCMSIIVNVLTLMSSGGGVGTDDSLPIIIYIVLKAQPKKLYSNLNYIYKFRHQSKMIGLNGFVFQQFQSAGSFIENLDQHSLTISVEDYNVLVEESKQKNSIS
jgi:GTPase-activator protein for Ras-like GTPase/Vacuolar sorting protein 9 (VPS9) domain